MQRARSTSYARKFSHDHMPLGSCGLQSRRIHVTFRAFIAAVHGAERYIGRYAGVEHSRIGTACVCSRREDEVDQRNGGTA